MSMIDDQIIVKAIPQSLVIVQQQRVYKPNAIRLFSLLVMFSILFGIYRWFNLFQKQINGRSLFQLDRYEIIEMIQLQNPNSFEQTVLKYKMYKFVTAAYIQPNIILAIIILITIPLVINFIQKQSSTSIVFFQFTGIGIYLQIIRMIFDGVQYFLTSKCFCLGSGTAAIWIHLLTKVTYYNFNSLLGRRGQLVLIGFAYLIFFMVVVVRDRFDILISVVIALIDIATMKGGTIKYPKQNFQEKERVAEWMKLDRIYLWQKFIWNQYRQNELMCLDNHQFYITREERFHINNE